VFLRGQLDMTDTDPKADTYSEAETVARREAALKRAFATPPKPHKDSKLGRRESRGNSG
jgi:hypothetical protein